LDGRFDVEEGDYYPPERLKWCPGVDLGMLVDGFAELGEGGDVKDLSCEQVLEMLVTAVEMWQVMHTVIMRVLEGGDGSTSGGRSERSRDSGDLFPDDARERCGEGTATCMFATVSRCKSMLTC
jgi:hypothetical protein